MADEKVDRKDIVIEGDTATWECNLDGPIKGTYMGTFRFRCFLTPTQKLAASREYRELLGTNPTLVLKHEDDLAFSLAQLKYRIISAPPFWTSAIGLGQVTGDVADENVIDAVLNAAVDAELIYKSQIKAKKAEAIERAKKAAERMLKNQEDEKEES